MEIKHAYNFQDLTGNQYGSWIAIDFVKTDKNGHSYWLCKCTCGKIKEVRKNSLLSGKSTNCGCGNSKRNLNRYQKRKSGQYQKGINNHHWKGGRTLSSKGYILRYSPEHPHARNCYVLEHRAIMEEILGRILTPEEVIHHIDGNKRNNDPENLMLFKNSIEHNEHHLKLKNLYKTNNALST